VLFPKLNSSISTHQQERGRLKYNTFSLDAFATFFLCSSHNQIKSINERFKSHRTAQSSESHFCVTRKKPMTLKQNETYFGLRIRSLSFTTAQLGLMASPHSEVPDIPGILQYEPTLGHLKQYVADLLQMRNYRYTTTLFQ
jgi:hypothetical protein